MNKEEIENRIIVCEMRANGYREVGNTKTADRYDNERYKWEKLLSDLELLDKRKVKELLDYRKCYFDLQQQNQKYKEVIDKSNNWVRNYMDEWSINDEVWQELNELLILLEEVE